MNTDTAKSVAVNYVAKPVAAYLALNVALVVARRVTNRRSIKVTAN